MNILTVDDDIMIIKGLKSIIQKMNLSPLKILSSYNAIDALEILKNNRIDMLITDVDMPVMSGLTLINKAKQYKYCDRFLVLSGFDKFEFVREALRHSVKDYLLKPVDKNELFVIIDKFHKEIHKVPKNFTKEKIPELKIYKYEINYNTMPLNLINMLNFLAEKYNKNISLEELGERFALHPNYICTLFKIHMDTTFLHYLDCLKLQKSVSLLINEENMSIKEIAELSGFSSERQFYTVFKKRIELTPGIVRKKYGQHNQLNERKIS